ncbi:hypothetical protein M153_7970002033 [Pseudoloma neurophilia]|uniref:Uncharacterized protein n=1 Tax=Pseudoloma neurophilia TaxID=146866 RepID=A0A0R0M3A2_9MICR|nr:hypothetical protein M153_7970002033 [Pseudoloma neurophilia]
MVLLSSAILTFLWFRYRQTSNDILQPGNEIKQIIHHFRDSAVFNTPPSAEKKQLVKLLSESLLFKLNKKWLNCISDLESDADEIETFSDEDHDEQSEGETTREEVFEVNEGLLDEFSQIFDCTDTNPVQDGGDHNQSTQFTSMPSENEQDHRFASETGQYFLITPLTILETDIDRFFEMYVKKTDDILEECFNTLIDLSNLKIFTNILLKIWKSPARDWIYLVLNILSTLVHDEVDNEYFQIFLSELKETVQKFYTIISAHIKDKYELLTVMIAVCLPSEFLCEYFLTTAQIPNSINQMVVFPGYKLIFLEYKDLIIQEDHSASLQLETLLSNALPKFLSLVKTKNEHQCKIVLTLETENPGIYDICLILIFSADREAFYEPVGSETGTAKWRTSRNQKAEIVDLSVMIVDFKSAESAIVFYKVRDLVV